MQVCVIGSGCGGATAARALAEAGFEVLVLEEGGDYSGSQLTQREGEMYDRLYMDRAGRATSDLGITILQGRVLGGGGVINMSDVVPISDAVLGHWQSSYGLSDFGVEQMAPHQERALKDLSAQRIPEDQLNRNNRLLRSGAIRLGWQGENMMHNRVGCRGIGACLIGCAANAKRNPRMTVIPEAIKAGAQFWIRARALRIEDGTKELKTIHVERLDELGHHRLGTLRLKAKIVILAANAVASAELLLRSGLGNSHVGRHLSLQPQIPVVAEYAEDVRMFRGIPQAYAITEFEKTDDPERGWWGLRIESIGSGPGNAAGLLPLFGSAGKELMARYPKLAAALVLTPDESVGRVRVKRSGRLEIDYALTDELRSRYKQGIRAAAQAYLAAGALQVIIPSTTPLFLRSESDLQKIDDLAFRPLELPMISAHQQGGLRFATSTKHGAADPTGQIYGTRDMYVMDSSGFPSTASSHTMAPIMTVSNYLSAGLVAARG